MIKIISTLTLTSKTNKEDANLEVVEVERTNRQNFK